MRRTPWTLKNNSYSHCNCPFCINNNRFKRELIRRNISDVRKVKSYEPFNKHLDSNVQEFLPKSQKPVHVLYQRNQNPNPNIPNSRSEESVNFKTQSRNFFGIRQKCHDSDRSRMPWSMANSHQRNPQDFNIEKSGFLEGENQETYDSRVFPFQSTPSGNLKVGPQQVVFESKKVSVLVADPKHTRVNVKAELAKQQEELASETPQSSLEPTKIMESEESRNAKKNQLLNAMVLMGNEARTAALNQIMPPGMPPLQPPPHNSKYKAQDDGLYTPNDLTDDREDARSVESDESPKPELNLVKLGFTASAPIDWSQIKLPQKTNLYKHMHYRITNYINPDCLVQIEDVQFNCHLLVLQCYSVYFNEKTSRDVVKLPADSVTPKAFELIYEWMTYVHGDSYTILKRDNILEVFSAAQFLGIKELEEQCWAFVDCEELFSEDTAFLLYLEAKKVGNTAVMELMIPRIMKFFLTLVSSKDYLDLKLDEVYVLLSSNYITVHSEIEVFMSAVRWLWHDWKTRKECLEQVMSCVRFGLIAPWQLVDIRRNPENPEFLEITSHPAVQQMIDNGLAYAIIKYWYGNQTGDYYHWIDLLGLTEPPTRNWAGEEKNYVTYREFLHDLEQYRKELFYEKERLRSKQIAKGKRGSEQSGLTTSPRDIIQQPERRTSNKKHPSSSNKNSRVDSTLADSMRNEIIKDFLETKKTNQTFNVYPCTVAAPPSIWNLNNSMLDVEIKSSKNYHQTSEKTKQNNPGKLNSSRIPLALNLKNGGRKTVEDEKEYADINEEKEKAAIVIQRAYKKYKRNLLDRKNSSSCDIPDSSSYSRHSSKNNNDHFRAPGRAMFEKLKLHNYPRANIYKDYLREGSLFFADRESVVVFGGIDPHSKYGDGRNTGRNIFRYNSETNQWDLVGELPQPRHHHAVAFFKGRIYLAGGTDPRDDDAKGKSVVVGTVWSYEPITRAWYKETEMITARKNFGLVVMNGKLLAIGGHDKNGRVLSSVEKYDPVTGVWEDVTPLNTARTGAAIGKYRDSTWVAGGMTNSKKLSSAVESYDYKHDKWIEQAPLRFPRCFSCLFSMNDTMYLIGGAGRVSEKDKSTSSCNAIDVWNPREQEWKLHFAMSIPRHGHAIAYLGTQILIIGGVTTAYLRALTDVECFCCERKTWVRGLASLPVPLSGHGAITLPPASLM